MDNGDQLRSQRANKDLLKYISIPEDETDFVRKNLEETSGNTGRITEKRIRSAYHDKRDPSHFNEMRKY
jgi:hypothetical protein